MKTIYEVKVARVSYDYGNFIGWEHIAFTFTAEKGAEIAAAWRQRAEHEKKQWWMTYGTDIEGHILVEVTKAGEVIE